MVLSFTKAGAKEISNKPSADTGQTIPIPKKNVGTLHAMCYRALDNPKIAEANVAQWNEAYPHLSMSPASEQESLNDFGAMNDRSSSDGYSLLASTNILRAHLRDIETWPMSERHFFKKWTEYKADCNLMDFSDLLEKSIERVLYAPGQPRVIFVDEAQDCSALQFKLIRQWALQAEYLVLAGDADQCLFDFAGCTPDLFLNPPIPENRWVHLEQSYRVPRTVHKFATEIIEKINGRAQKFYRPKNLDGNVRSINATYMNCDPIIIDLKQKLAAGKKAMVLTSCSYMLEPIKKALTDEGIPFHNPYRKRRGDWNPLRIGSERYTSGGDILLAFLSIDQLQFLQIHSSHLLLRVRWLDFL
jgi:superfamily I DNA/RNA helicase